MKETENDRQTDNDGHITDRQTDRDRNRATRPLFTTLYVSFFIILVSGK